jgi:thioredoxin-like negative regulator of GroEL
MRRVLALAALLAAGSARAALELREPDSRLLGPRLPPPPIVDVTFDDYPVKVMSSTGPVVVLFTSWGLGCKECPELEWKLGVVARQNFGRLKVCRVDADAEGRLARMEGIKALPALLYGRDGGRLRRVRFAVETDAQGYPKGARFVPIRDDND